MNIVILILLLLLNNVQADYEKEDDDDNHEKYKTMIVFVMDKEISTVSDAREALIDAIFNNEKEDSYTTLDISEINLCKNNHDDDDKKKNGISILESMMWIRSTLNTSSKYFLTVIGQLASCSLKFNIYFFGRLITLLKYIYTIISAVSLTQLIVLSSIAGCIAFVSIIITFFYILKYQHNIQESVTDNPSKIINDNTEILHDRKKKISQDSIVDDW